MARKIFIVGFMGSGKSTFGRRLAVDIEMDFLDTDEQITRIMRKTISEIFRDEGEERFREIEKGVLRDLSRLQVDTVVSLGGGTVCRRGVMGMLNRQGLTFYLKMSPEKLVSRLDKKARAKRPKIAGMDDPTLLEYIQKTLPEREKYYNQANFAVDCNTASDRAILRTLTEIVRSIEQRNKINSSVKI